MVEDFSYYERLISLISYYYRLISIALILMLLALTLVSITNLIKANYFRINPHARPTLYAVYILSPVNIQTLIFALNRSLIVYGTSSCKSSCTAVAPNKNKLFSSSYCSFYNSFNLFYDKRRLLSV